ncbi:hypothetical protein [Marinitenerispora sediminis]|uniref:hypothetical protein n=1 Tax=Marinitenerispora sediminis TaxID=1931232 RepID=UPI0035A93E74
MTGVRKLYTTLVEAVRRPTMLGQLRRQVLFFVPLPIPLFAVLVLAHGGLRWSAPGWTILVAFSVAVAALLLAFVVQPTPLPEGLSAEASVRRSLHRFRQITALRIGLALTPIAVGAGASLAGGGLFPFLAALLLAWPQLLLALPGYFTVSRARKAMEAWGTKAYLWAALAQPSPVEWPVVTQLARRIRAARAARSAGGTAGAGASSTEAAADSDREPEGVLGDHADLPERWAVPASEPPQRPEILIPGMSATPSARAVQRGRNAARRRSRRDAARSRPKAKN